MDEGKEQWHAGLYRGTRAVLAMECTSAFRWNVGTSAMQEEKEHRLQKNNNDPQRSGDPGASEVLDYQIWVGGGGYPSLVI